MASTCLHPTSSLLLSSPSSPSHRDRDPFFVPRSSSRFNARHARSYSQEIVPHAPPTPPTPSAAPALSTALRAAHRRARSTATVPTVRSLLSPPPTAEPARSPLGRFSSPSPDTNTMATSLNGFSRDPFTPVKNSVVRVGDSPFSDYFSDREEDARTSPEKQRLLVRLNKLQSQLLSRDADDERETLEVVERKVDEIELHLNTIHSQTRMPPELEDSGLFMEEDDEDEDGDIEDGRSSPVTALQASLDGTVDDTAATEASKQASHEHLLAESQRVLASVTQAQDQLRQRHDELKALHDASILQLEDRDRQIDDLQSETSALQSDLEFDHSELLFLRLQFKALELDISALDAGAQRLESYAPEIKKDIQKVKRERIAEEMRRWERDWEDVDARMRRRRGRYAGVFAKADSAIDGNGVEEGDWQLETVEKRDGRVLQITIRRLDGKGEAFDIEHTAVEAEEEAATEEEEPAEEEEEPASLEDYEEDEQEDPGTAKQSRRPSDTAEAEDKVHPLHEWTHVPHKHKHRTYTHSTTQTVSSSGHEHEALELFPTESSIACEYMIRNDMDCAITTSSESGDTSDDESDSDSLSGFGVGDVEVRFERPFSFFRAKEAEVKDGAVQVDMQGKVDGRVDGKTPWQELLDGLANFAGLGAEDRF